MRLRLFLLWLRITRPRVYARLMRWWKYQLLELICNQPVPHFFYGMGKVSTEELKAEWRIDPQ